MPSGNGPGRSWFKVSISQLLTGALLAVTAAGLVVTIKAHSQADDLSRFRRDELIGMLDTLQDNNAELEASIRQLRSLRDELTSGAAGAQAAQAAARQRLGDLQLLSGEVAASGPGIRVLVTDENRVVTAELLLEGIEELRDAGAEVIELNDTVRLTARSWLGADADGTIIADGQRLAAPYLIEAIGEPSTLAAGIQFRGGFVARVDAAGAAAQVARETRIEIQSTVAPHDFQFAQPK